MQQVLLHRCDADDLLAVTFPIERRSVSTTTAILGVHRVPSLTQERYEEVVRRLTDGRGHPLRSTAELPFEGLLVHVAAQTDRGFLIFDVFESQAAFERFGERMGTIAKEAGITEGLKLYPVHTCLSVDTAPPMASR
jgi:hypothetical protein